jgi:DNA-binding GntR family transcriptional regulator
VKIERVSADAALAQRFGVGEGERINKVSRVKTANGQPVDSMTDYVLEDVLPSEHLPREFAGSVLDILLSR